MTKVAVIIGSTRPNRFGPQVANWFFDRAKQSDQAEFELVDLADHNLPLLDEPTPAASTKEHTKKWAAKIAEFDGYVLVTPEYNHAPPASLKNALDFLNNEWKYKPVSYVSYGVIGGSRAVEQLRPIAANFSQYDLRAQVMIVGPRNFLDENGQFQPSDQHNQSADSVIKEISFWSEALAPIRAKLQNQ